MEQARHWMWSKRNHGFNSHLQPSTNSSYEDSSWEEQAFAEDAAGPLGGCIWPPRSYSCSFCGREFRSAQALGGHMNVHRRDRARLKQSPNPNNEILHNDNQNPYTSMGFQDPVPQICTSVYSPNPNSDPNAIIISPTSSTRVSTTPTQGNFHEKSFFPSLSSSTLEEPHKRSPQSSPPLSRPNTVADKYYHISDPKSGEKNSRILESECRTKVIDHYVKTDLSVSLNLVVRRTRPTISDGDEEDAIICKKRRTDSPSLPTFVKQNSLEVLQISPCAVEELDLELRLGDRPKDVRDLYTVAMLTENSTFHEQRDQMYALNIG